ncbi:MAG: hypothetical protein V3S97_08005 [Candidatus Bathyarchaeia archaeon]
MIRISGNTKESKREEKTMGPIENIQTRKMLGTVRAINGGMSMVGEGREG